MISELIRIAKEMEAIENTAKHASADMLLTQALETFEDDETSKRTYYSHFNSLFKSREDIYLKN